MGEVKFINQALDRLGLLERIQILALNILDQRDREGLFVGDFALDHRDVIQTRQLGSAPASLPRNNFKPSVAVGSNQDGLDQPVNADRGR